MYNRAILIGRLTADPEMRTTPNGVNVASFRIAVDRPFPRAQRERLTSSPLPVGVSRQSLSAVTSPRDVLSASKALSRPAIIPTATATSAIRLKSLLTEYFS